MSTDASSRANSWAAQRKQAIDKAKQGREERKFNLAKAGEMSVANEMTSAHLARVTSSENHRDYQKPPMPDFPLNSKKPATMKYGMSLLDQQPTEEELIQARTSLRLLKSKMKDSNGFPTMARTADQYMEHGQGDRRTGQSYNNYNDSDQNDNRNYRKVFKPSFKDEDYNQMNNNLNRDLNQIDKTLSQKGRGSNAGTNYPSQNYDPPQPSRTRDNAKPPIGINRNAYDANRNMYDNPNEDFQDFSSKNIPSRIPKNTMSANKSKPSSMYDDDYSAQFNNKQQPPKYPGNRNYMEEDSPPPKKNYQDYDYKPQQQQPQYNRMQENPLAKNNYDSGFNKPNNMNKGWPSNVNNNNNAYNNSRQPYDDRDNDNNAVFSKPNLKKAQPPANQQQNSRSNANDDFDSRQPKGKGQPPMNPYPNSRPSANDDLDNRPLKGADNQLPSEFAKTGPLQECPMGCGRSFNADVIDKHAKVCQKVFQSKRKKFISSEQRQLDEQGETQYESKYNPPKSYKPPAKAGAAGGKSAKWKQQSEAFRANLKAARGAPLSQEEQVKLAQANTEHLVPCPCCGRKFNEHAAARHIPFCESKQKVDTFKKGGKAKK